MKKSIVMLVFLIVIIMMQIFLSKRKNKWFGLILPIISFLYSIMTVYALMVFSGKSSNQDIMQFVMLFLVSNMPTVILSVIHFACREKFKKNKEIDKMNIQDLH